MKKKKIIKKKKTNKKIVKKTRDITACRGPRPYKKCVELVVQMAESFADFGDCSDKLLDEIAVVKKRLNEREQVVISQLASGVSSPRIIEIDEASPGNELQIKI